MVRLHQIIAWLAMFSLVASFAPSNSTPRHRSPSSLDMAKKLRNKQAELMKKLSDAKKQKQASGAAEETPKDAKKLSDKEMKEMNDRRRFDELLKSNAGAMGNIALDGYLTREQEEAEIEAYRKGADRLFEGDPAPTQPFEELLNVKSDNALGDAGTKRLVPWLKSSNPSDYLVIVCDPRVKSPELREAVQSLNNELPKGILSRTVVINADTPAENRRWVKKSGLQSIQILSDEKREWMRSYTALGEDRWSMTMFVVSDERLQKIAREMPSISAVKTIHNAVKALEAERL